MCVCVIVLSLSGLMNANIVDSRLVDWFDSVCQMNTTYFTQSLANSNILHNLKQKSIYRTNVVALGFNCIACSALEKNKHY